MMLRATFHESENNFWLLSPSGQRCELTHFVQLKIFGHEHGFDLVFAFCMVSSADSMSSTYLYVSQIANVLREPVFFIASELE
jgi:hypothetical protein